MRERQNAMKNTTKNEKNKVPQHVCWMRLPILSTLSIVHTEENRDVSKIQENLISPNAHVDVEMVNGLWKVDTGSDENETRCQKKMGVRPVCWCLYVVQREQVVLLLSSRNVCWCISPCLLSLLLALQPSPCYRAFQIKTEVA